MQFTDKDLQQIQQKGIDAATVEKQIEQFKKGFPYVQLYRPATPENGGIRVFEDSEKNKLAQYFDDNKHDYQLLKFVPASGAASRMFKNLLVFFDSFKGTPEEIDKLQRDTDFNSAGYFFQHLKEFAFFKALEAVLKIDNLDIDILLQNNDYITILKYLLTGKGLNYANEPKALIYFHDYPDGPRRAFEEHLVEATKYATDKDNVAKVHFTISPEHKFEFETAVNNAKDKYEKRSDIHFNVSFSQQKPSTDTLAVDMDNKPFRNADGSLLFRPGGHGALIENLNDLEEEIVFIKNIDNIVPDRLRGETYLYKRIIGGLLFKLQEQTFEWLEKLEDGNLSDTEMVNIETFAGKELNIFFPDSYRGYEKIEQIDWLYNKLNRPMRVAGMVKNEGEPGGGPFWIKNQRGEISLQIVESSQINLKDPGQKDIVAASTHFNPVDLVCGLHNFKGEPFHLPDFVDPDTGFISQKSKDGKDLKALELPGLWNGAMAEWITVFVEVPLITFNPVKIINDLLRPQHQPS